MIMINNVKYFYFYFPVNRINTYKYLCILSFIEFNFDLKNNINNKLF